MNTYLVRTKLDQALMGIFCAASPVELATVIDEVFNADECEYLQMKANEGLFIEAQFVMQASPEVGGSDQVTLVHVDDPAAIEDSFTREENFGADMANEAGAEAQREAELLMLAAEGEYIAPVLEPTGTLNTRLQSAHRAGEWQPVRPRPARTARHAKRETSALLNKPINPDSIARKLMEGALNPANYIHNASQRRH